jgi:hypothetical protein
MRNQRQFRPSADALEDIYLLSTMTFMRGGPVRPTFVGPQPVAISPVITPTVNTNQPVQLNGTASGSYSAQASGNKLTYTLSGSPSNVTPFGAVTVSGSLQSPGSSSNDQTQGTLVLSDGNGSTMTLQVTGSPQRRLTQVANLYTYTVVDGSGKFQGSTGTSGVMYLTLSPNPTTNPTLNQTGNFAITFTQALPRGLAR